MKSGLTLHFRALSLIMLLAVVLRFLWIEDKSLWNDEAFSVRVALQPIPDVVASIAADVHPPFYYLLLHLWLWVAPPDETTRYISGLIGAAAMPLIYLLARGFVGRSQALVAMAICAILPYYVSWAQVSRAYAVLFFFSMLALLASARLLSRLSAGNDAGDSGLPHAARRRSASEWQWGATYVFAGWAALWTHNIGAFLLLGINAAAGWRVLTGQLRGTRAIILWSVCQVSIILLWSPWIPVVLEQSSRFSLSHFLVTFSDVIGRIITLLGGFMLWKLDVFAALVALIGAVLGASQIARRTAEGQVVLAGILVPLLACLILFLAGKPTMGYSIANLVWIPALVAMLVAANIRLPERGQRTRATIGVALALVFVLLMGRGLQNWYSVSNPGWDRVAARIAADIRPGDALVATTDITGRPEAPDDIPMHALVLYWNRLRLASPHLPVPTRPPEGEEEIRVWMDQHEGLWVPRFLPMGDTTPSMRVVALAERDPERWSLTHETISRLALTRITRIRLSQN